MLQARVVNKLGRSVFVGNIGACINYRAGLEPDYMKPREFKIIVKEGNDTRGRKCKAIRGI